MSATILKVAICVFPQVTALDYQGPVELFAFVSPSSIETPHRLFPGPPSHALKIDYVSHTKEPITPSGGPDLLANRTYQEVLDAGDQYDILLVPGGLGARPQNQHPSLLEFVHAQAPRCEYIMSVCTGSWVLANAGVLDGKKATSNKAAFKSLKEATKERDIEWIAKARWVVDGKVWTSSGVAAGMDMAAAFLKHLVGPDVTHALLSIVELRARDEGDDEFAEIHGLTA